VFDEIHQNGIDLSFEEARAELEEQGKTDDEIDEALQDFESHLFLFGPAWVKVNGKYSIDKTKDFAASYNSETGVICVEYSQTIKACHHTSPCYVMADGSGPCGDLNTKGDSVKAYALPDDYSRGSEDE
jgi:hypothetical protein